MAEQMITEDNDPELWYTLYEIYEAEGKPRDVIKSKKMYRALQSYQQKIVFVPVATLDYLDSRSWKPSKKTTYKKLFGDK